MFSRKTHYKTVLSVTDDMVTSLTLAQDRSGFFVHNHQSLKLPEGVIVQGEILKADMFATRLRKIKEQIPEGTVDLLLPYENFVFSGAQLQKSAKSQQLKKRIREYFATTDEREPWFQTHVCEYSVHPRELSDCLVFRCLPQDMFQSYFFLFQKLGLAIKNIVPDVLAFDHIFNDERTRVLYVGEESTRLVEYQYGMYVQTRAFQFSYQQLRNDIITHTRMSEDQAQKVLERYGVLRSHPEEKVYRKIVRSLGPLLEALQKKKVKNLAQIALVFEGTSLKGMSDIIEKTTKLPTRDFDMIMHSHYPFHEVLSIHRKKLPLYYAHIAQALKSFEK